MSLELQLFLIEKPMFYCGFLIMRLRFNKKKLYVSSEETEETDIYNIYIIYRTDGCFRFCFVKFSWYRKENAL